ncbi:hypothetical protein DFH83_002797 [Clostridium saccharobutylicum]|nr:hypothetical protein [Clostridium saccharobutylicum]
MNKELYLEKLKKDMKEKLKLYGKRYWKKIVLNIKITIF